MRLGPLLAALLLVACLPDPAAGDPDGGSGDPQDASQGDGGAGDTGVAPGPITFKLMTWNVANFFDDIDDPAKQDDVLTTAAMNAKIAAVAKVVKAMKPDILALQEVENLGMLNKLCDALSPTLTLQNRVLIEAFDPRGIDVALCSKFPIIRTVSHTADRLYTADGRGPFKYSRDDLEVHLNVAGREVVVLVNHQISQLQAGDEFEREAQALGTRQTADALRKENSARPVFIVGDMNDDRTQATCATSSNCTAPLICSQKVCMGASLPLYLDSGAWIDLALDVTSADRWTETFGSRKQRIDWILADVDTAKLRKLVEIPHATLTTDVKAASDHFPVAATFTLP